MVLLSPLFFSQQLLTALGTQMFFHYQDRVPRTSPLVLVSNHRSVMDAPLLMAAIDRTVRFVCHHYMGEVPLLRDVVTRFGALPLESSPHRQHEFFQHAVHLLQQQQVVGIFPEGAHPMLNWTSPQEVGDFQRGFAHLALRSPVDDLAVLPVAIAPQAEMTSSAFPIRWLSQFDPSEPLFQQPGWHPMVMYRRVDVLVGKPLWITPNQRQAYRSKQARSVIQDLTHQCHDQIGTLLQRG